MDSFRERSKMLLNHKRLKRMPINLRKKAIREARNLAGMQQQEKSRKRQPKSTSTPARLQNDFERAEHNAMLSASSQELQRILSEFEELADVPYDATPAELLGLIAQAENRATTIYVQRDGLSTLKIMLHQRSPSVAQLKKAIATISCAQLKRRQRERRRAADEVNAGRTEDASRQQVVGSAGAKVLPRSSGELVNSALRNGHEHRALVSWRFLWRCFALFNVDTNQPIDDNVDNGRATLTALGIENGATLKFVHRVKYFGRKRQS
ncbi:uncharacterized protein LOC111601140 [Drosophila hydei]|uniref:Uncharacterized protein LOC111601140 n=1 Tax=Drosophila hydei TaxID=7224 RepID=A0A6J1M0R9_DROHY|nr:uncharacterized protein LOC111601140 [Drosophila hydei]